jgi:5-methylcytosine-specific restriction protein B
VKKLRPERVSLAIEALFSWRNTIQAQATAHLLPLLALLEAGAGNFSEIRFEEVPDEYEFWNRYFRISDPPKLYFNPLTKKMVDEHYPHSNAATIRKNTFANRWHAVRLRLDGSESYWQLVENYADIVRKKMLTKASFVARVPIIDLASILLREKAFEDNATSDTLVEVFRNIFPMRDEDFSQLFDIGIESIESLFTTDTVSRAEYNSVIRQTMLADDPKTEKDSTPHSIPEADDADPHLLLVQELLRLGTSGIIFRGAPGTGKTRQAHRIARRLVYDATEDIFTVQFHPAFGYEDFVEGYRPNESATSGFEISDKIFLAACTRARDVKGYVVVLIDEINRGDPARIFGELLTYIERDYRNKLFKLPFSGKPFSIPDNILLIGTLNPYDRSVAQIDAAFMRRFDHISVDPSSEGLSDVLRESLFSQSQLELIISWFERAQEMMPIGLGHGLFSHVKDIASLRTIWRYRIEPTCEAILDHDPEKREGLVKSFDALLGRLEDPSDLELE